MKRRMSNLPGVIPAMTEWVIEPGDKARAFSPEGDPRDPLTDLSQAYLVPDPFILQPSYIAGFIGTDPFSDDEIQRFEADLSAPITERMLAEVHRATSEFVCTVALQRRLASWKQIENQLQLILQTCETLVSSANLLRSLTNPNVVDDSVSRGALSADQLVKKMLMDMDNKANAILHVNLTPVVASCTEAVKVIKLKTKRGRKPELVFRLFLKRLVSVMKANGHDIKLPSNDNVFDNYHPTFIFINTVLEVCIEKGKAAVIASELDETEKSEATRVLSHYRKSERAIVHYLRDGSIN